MTFEYSERFKKRLEKKPPDQVDAILRCIKKLEQELASPVRRHGLRVKKMSGYSGVYEARIDRSNRLTFERAGDRVVLRTHCNHSVLGRP